jgi:hypothetical protein
MSHSRGSALFRYRLSLPLLVVCIATFAVGIAFCVVQPIIYTNDTDGYLEAARFFIGAPDGKYAYLRTPLFPMLLAVTGVAAERSLHGLVAVHLVLGLAIPILIYFSLSWVGRWSAAGAAIVSAATLIPFLNVGYVMTSQLFTFMLVLTVFFACRFIATQRAIDMYASIFGGFLAMMVRPQGSALFVVLAPMFFVAAPGKWRHCIAAIVAVIALQFTYMAARPHFVGPIAASGEVLLSDLSQDVLIPDDQALYRRALLFVRQNLTGSAEIIARFIHDPALARQVRLASILQDLLNRNPDGALKQALASNDEEVRDQGLYYVAWQRAATDDKATAQLISDQIGSSAIKAKLKEVWDRPVDIPLLTSAAPLNGRLEPRPYVTDLDMTDTAGKNLLYPAFLSRYISPDALIVPENGPATTELYRILNIYFGTPGLVDLSYPDAAEYLDDSVNGVHRFLTQYPAPPAGVHWTLWVVLDRLVGPTQANGLLRSVFIEFAERHPVALGRIYLGFIFQDLLNRNVLRDQTSMPIAGTSTTLPNHPDVATIPVFRREIAKSKLFLDTYVALAQEFGSLSVLFIPILVSVAASGALVIRERRLLLSWGVCLLVAFHQFAVCAITIGSFFVYTSASYLFLIMAAAISIYSAVQLGLRSWLPAALSRTSGTG